MSARLRPTLEVLEARDVPAALIDLTYRGAEAAANGALFRQTDAQPTGSGVIHSFLRVHAGGVEQGHNTDARPLFLDENESPTFTRSLALADVPVVRVNNVTYREFLLDINQKSSAPLLSLDELRLYVGDRPDLSGYNATARTLAGLAPVYDMDGGGDVTVKMDYRLNPGSGGGDVTVLVPNAAFAGAGGYVYLYSKFGDTWGANAGFEEWAVRAGAQQAPAGISGTVSLDANGDHAIDPADAPLPGIVVNLYDVAGNLVAYTVSGPDGTYSFSELSPGTYSVMMQVPSPNYVNMYPAVGGVGADPVGTVDQTWAGITDIQLNAGDQATGYNLGLWDTGV